MTPELVPLARNMYRLSLHETQNFPFLVLSINVTRIALHALRDELLDKQSVRENSVWSAVNYFYVAVMFHIYKVQYHSMPSRGHSQGVAMGALATTWYKNLHFLGA